MQHLEVSGAERRL